MFRVGGPRLEQNVLAQEFTRRKSDGPSKFRGPCSLSPVIESPRPATALQSAISTVDTCETLCSQPQPAEPPAAQPATRPLTEQAAQPAAQPAAQLAAQLAVQLFARLAMQLRTTEVY